MYPFVHEKVLNIIEIGKETNKYIKMLIRLETMDLHIMSHFNTEVHIVSHPCSHNEPVFSEIIKSSKYGQEAPPPSPHP